MAEDLGSLVAKLGADLTDLKRGLLEGRQQFASFQQVIESGAAKVKSVLQFAGVTVGLYEIVSRLKEFSASVLKVGADGELLKASAYTIGQYFQVSGTAVDFYVQKLKDLKVTEDEALYAINAFLKAGLSLDFLPQLAQAAKDLAPSMGQPFLEAFNNIIQGIVKGTPRQLAELVPGIKQVIQGVGNETKKIMDVAVLSGPERAQIMLDYVLQAAQKAKGTGDAVIDSYMAKLAEYKFRLREVKEALFEFVKPVAMAVTQEEIKSWEDLYGAIGHSKEALREAGETVGVWVGKVAATLRTVTAFLAQHKDLLLVLLQIKGIVTVMKWTGLAAGAEAVSAVLVKLGLLRAALAGPWVLAIAVTLVGLNEAWKQVQSLARYHPEYMGGAEWIPTEEQKASGLAEGRQLKYKPAEAGVPSPFGGLIGQKPEISAEEARRQAEAAAARGRAEGALPGAGGKGGKGGKGAADDLLGEFLKMLEAKRQAELQESQNSFDLLKATNDKKKAELERALAAQEIDGRTYYQRLQDLQAEETAAALAMIDKKRQAQQQAYQDALTSLQSQALSPEALDLAQQRLAAENRKHLSTLDAEAAKVKLEGERKVTEELRRQVEVRRQYQEKTEDLNLETNQLLGIISEQEGKLQRLFLDWQRAKQEALKAGAAPEYFQALEASYQAKVGEARYGDQFRSIGSEFSSGVANIINGIRQGTVDIGKTLTDMFNNIMMAVLKPGFDALGKGLTDAIKWLFNSLLSSVGGESFSGYGLAGADAQGNAYNAGIRLAFASGGIVTRPTLFALAGGAGLMGEAGPEAILPLTRVGGDLGVKALLPKSGPAQVNIINKLGVEAQGQAVMRDDGSLDVFLEKKVAGYVARGPVNQLIKAISKG